MKQLLLPILLTALIISSACKKDDNTPAFKLKFEAGTFDLLSCTDSVSTTQNGAGVNITFDNQCGEAVNVYWINTLGQRVLYQTISNGFNVTQPTFVHHPWLVTRVTGDVCIGIVRCKAESDGKTITIAYE